MSVQPLPPSAAAAGSDLGKAASALTILLPAILCPPTPLSVAVLCSRPDTSLRGRDPLPLTPSSALTIRIPKIHIHMDSSVVKAWSPVQQWSEGSLWGWLDQERLGLMSGPVR